MNREAAVRIASELDLSPALVSVCSGQRLQHPFDIYLGSPEEFYLMTDAELLAGGWDSIVALWDDGNFGELTAFHLPRQVLVSFYVEDRIDISALPGLSVQQALFPHLLRMYEGECPIEQIREAAALFGFDHVEQMLTDLQSELIPAGNFQAYERWQEHFRRGLVA